MSDYLKDGRQQSANRLREIRMNMGESQEKFAEYLDMSLSAYKKIESAENGVSVRVLRKLKEKFNISSDYLLYGDYKNIDNAMDVIQNCTEADKLRILLRLTQYFVDDKKKLYVEADQIKEEKAVSEILKHIFNIE